MAAGASPDITALLRAWSGGDRAALDRQVPLLERELHRIAKRGGEGEQLPLDEALAVSPEPDTDVLAVDAALEALSQVDPRKARVVELKFFGGLSVEETAAVLGLSAESLQRDWHLAKAWLARELRAR
jgi:RNA polymerase sigma factor (TIGR02999 family)